MAPTVAGSIPVSHPNFKTHHETAEPRQDACKASRASCVWRLPAVEDCKPPSHVSRVGGHTPRISPWSLPLSKDLKMALSSGESETFRVTSSSSKGHHGHDRRIRGATFATEPTCQVAKFYPRPFFFRKVPSWSSVNACCSCSCVFITIGPYHATGSSSGFPETSRKRIPSSPA